MTHDRETVDLTGEEFYDEDDLEELDEPDEPDEIAGADAPAAARPGGGAKDPYVPGGERLHKVLAHAGVASRRACEGLIAAGRVSVDGVVVTDQGVRVDPAAQVIRVDGSRIIADPDILTVVLHKPAGVVTTMADPDGRPTVADFARRHLQAHAGDIAHPAPGRPGAVDSAVAVGPVQFVRLLRLLQVVLVVELLARQVHRLAAVHHRILPVISFSISPRAEASGR